MAFEEFNARETSVESGIPIRLYTIEWGKTVWRYTSADQDIQRYEMVPDDEGEMVRALVTYTAVACNDEGMVQGGSSSNSFTLHIPGNLPVVELFRSTPPSGSLWLTVRTLHAAEPGKAVVPVISPPRRYWRVVFENGRSNYYAAEEIILRGERGGPNLANNINGIASASSIYGEPYRARFAFDGNTDTFWHSIEGGEQWIAYTFGAPVSIAEVAYQSRTDFNKQTPKIGRVEYSNTGFDWVTFFDFSLGQFADSETKVLGPALSMQESEAPIYWIGTIANIKRPDPAKGMIIGRPLTATFKRVGLRLSWTRGCPYALYDEDCRVNPDDHRLAGVVQSANGATVRLLLPGVVDAGSMDKWRGGILEWEANADGTIDSRTIEDVTALTYGEDGAYMTLNIFGTADRIDNDAACSILPGCDLTPETCSGRFANMDNYGGFRQMAGKSPFDGTPIF